MKAWLTVAAVLLVPACSYAQAAPAAPVAKPCEELKSEIAAKLDAKGVKSYSLEIVPKDQDAEGKEVGSCEGGTKKIMYRRTAAPPQTPAPQGTPKRTSQTLTPRLTLVARPCEAAKNRRPPSWFQRIGRPSRPAHVLKADYSSRLEEDRRRRRFAS